MDLIRTTEMGIKESLGKSHLTRRQQLQTGIREILLLTLLLSCYIVDRMAAMLRPVDCEESRKIRALLGPATPWFEYWLLTKIKMLPAHSDLLLNIRQDIVRHIQFINSDLELATQEGVESEHCTVVPEHTIITNPNEVADKIYGVLLELLDHPDVARKLKEWHKATDEEVHETIEEFRADQTELKVLFQQNKEA
jgi:hypothetical protein